MTALALALASMLYAKDGAFCTADMSRDFDSPCFIPQTCAECSTDSECDALCHVPACSAVEQVGCWMPDDLSNPTTRNWWR
jgi:hypothetical protein